MPKRPATHHKWSVAYFSDTWKLTLLWIDIQRVNALFLSRQLFLLLIMNPFSQMSVEKLQKQAKTIKLVTGMLAGMLAVLLVMAILLSIKKGFSTLVVVPFGLLPIVLINVNSLKQIKKELESRGEAI
ncbi:hypothetical protein [Spirosoma validum]|nr:hypothetical protein [Spirosoma validum]